MSRSTRRIKIGAIDISLFLVCLAFGAFLVLMGLGYFEGTPAHANPPVTTTTVHRPHVTPPQPARPLAPSRGMNNQYHSIYINSDPNYETSDNNDYVVATKCAGFGHFRVWMEYDKAIFVNSDPNCPY